MSEPLTLLLIMLISIFIVSTFSFILIYHDTSKHFEKRVKKKPTKHGLDPQTIERLKNKLKEREEIQNLEEIIHRLRILRREAEEILNDSGRN